MVTKALGILLLAPLGLYGTQMRAHVEMTADPLVAVTALMHTFNTLGYRYQIDSLSTQNSVTQIHGAVIGLQPLNPTLLAENLQDEGMKLAYARMNNGEMELGIDSSAAVWNVQLLGIDEGAQMHHSTLPYWFRVEAGQEIHISPPYAGKWYPDVSVLDASMHVLYSYRSDRSLDELNFPLPEGAYYLKVSNRNGMKELKEGMWIESMSLGR